MTSLLIAGPASEPVSLAEARSWLRVDNMAEDDLIAALIPAARLQVEAATRRLLISQSWRIIVDAWPADGLLPLPLAPFLSLQRIEVHGSDGAAFSLAPEDYSLDTSPEHARIRLLKPLPLRLRPLAGVSLEVTFGYGPAPEDVPQPLRQAILMILAHLYENRGDGNSAWPPSVAALIAPYRRARLA